MLLQDSRAGCGPTALVNGLKALGVDLAPKAAKVLAGMDHEGTDERGLQMAIRRLDYLPRTVRSRAQLIGHLNEAEPVLLAVDPDDKGWASHWVTAIGVLGCRIVVVDAADNYLIQVWDEEKLRKRWTCPKGGPFYGIAICPKEE